ncbi:MAG: carbamoyl phosphate synthase small subunit [Candidatus Fischerbacteria bacterium RBG_13_37_8]|uniref:Carbamoyl phosphate synthase small chain n=1 Tax=Candidatus Fischerbacteria bacterium RBG_13_37_8 TaxID=1817863 RepID=A0A1F5V953_9BACT|nr:MAG: carbamoyl phosphate synthase small subunit [Candidatus Fischerbacteria bacterium RBG_13_37_8]
MTRTQCKQARLNLEDGSEYHGYCFGAEKAVTGEVVFNTGMLGYPESLTDPSYKGQILVLTYPLIGNYGVPEEQCNNGLSLHFESNRIQIQALIISNYSDTYSHWNAKKSLSDWMKEHDIPGIYGIDTRELTKKLREQGTMLGKIIYSDEVLQLEDPNLRNLVSEVSIASPILYEKGKKKVVIVDCGVKNNIIHAFLRRDITVLRCPWDYDFLAEKADGIVLSNGPGDPKMCTATIDNVRRALSRNTPILGICLGSQILGLAAGANTYKLKYGHRAQNQPCVETGTKRCYITSQNHGYAVDAETLPEDWREWFFNNNDKTNEGIIHISKPFFGTQFHPEASPGPDDTEFIFDMFIRAL